MSVIYVTVAIESSFSVTYNLVHGLFMSVFMDNFCSHFKLDRSGYSFYTSGKVMITDYDTPKSLSIKEGDVIIVSKIKHIMSNPNTQHALNTIQTNARTLYVVVGEEIHPITFKLDSTTNMSELMDYYCSHCDISRMYYLFRTQKGVVVKYNDTADSLSLKDGDKINVRYNLSRIDWSLYS